MTDAGVVVWYNPSCSKCRGAGELLAAYGVPEQRVFYLDNPPSEAEIARVLALLGTDDPRALMRTGEARYAELGLAGASRDELIAAMARYPELIERPVVIWPDRAIVARPPELLLPLLEAAGIRSRLAPSPGQATLLGGSGQELALPGAARFVEVLGPPAVVRYGGPPGLRCSSPALGWARAACSCRLKRNR